VLSNILYFIHQIGLKYIGFRTKFTHRMFQNLNNTFDLNRKSHRPYTINDSFHQFKEGQWISCLFIQKNMVLLLQILLFKVHRTIFLEPLQYGCKACFAGIAGGVVVSLHGNIFCCLLVHKNLFKNLCLNIQCHNNIIHKQIILLHRLFTCSFIKVIGSI
jgi:hypothetical protein